MRCVTFGLATLLLLATAPGCTTAGARIRANPGLWDSLDARTQRAIKRGEVQLGFTEEMVRMALGNPTLAAGGMAGTDEDATWIYRHDHRNPNDYVVAGYRRRVVFDPVRGGNVVITEPVDPRTQRHLTPHSLHIGFRDGRVIAIQRVDDL